MTVPRTAASICRKAAVVLSGLILSLLLLEAGLRVGGFVLSSLQESENLRQSRQKGTYRILCLGESTTAGQYPHLLERVLNRRNIGVHFSVIDKGKAAINTITLLEGLEANLQQYKPDMVVVMMGINDTGIKYYEEVPRSDSWLFQHCRIYRFGSILIGHSFHLRSAYAKSRERKEESSSGPSSDLNRKLDIKSPSVFGKAVSAGKSPLDPEPPHFEGPQNLGSERVARDSEKAYLRDGELYKNQGKFSQAENCYKNAIAINPRNDNIYVDLGWLYRIQGQYGQAETFYKKALELNPKNAHACGRLGWLYSDLGKFSEAETFYKKAIELNPNKDSAYFALAMLYRKQGKLVEAEASCKRAAEIDPQNERTLGALASLYEEMGKPELAKAYAEKANQLRSAHYSPITVNNYRKLKEILDEKRIRLVCVQYPVRSIEPLKKIFGDDKHVIFVDNERIFKEAVQRSGYEDYFKDMFAGDFGHCTPKGNMLIAQNITNVILKEVFLKE